MSIKAVSKFMTDYCYTNGILNYLNGMYLPPPFTVFPTIIPHQHMDYLRSSQHLWATLVHRMTEDIQLLHKIFQHKTPYIDNAFNAYTVYNPTKKSINIIKSTYKYNTIKQLPEYITMRSWPFAASKLPALHKCILNMQRPEFDYFIPNHNHAQRIGLIFDTAIKHRAIPNEQKRIVLVTNKQQNIKEIESLLLEKYNIKCTTLSLAQIHDVALIQNGDVYISDHKIHLFYFMHTEADYNLTDKDWKARKLIEKSNAITSPSIRFQLALLPQFIEYTQANITSIYSGDYKMLSKLTQNPAFSQYLESPCYIYQNGNISKKIVNTEISLLSAISTDGDEIDGVYNDLGYSAEVVATDSLAITRIETTPIFVDDKTFNEVKPEFNMTI